MYSTSLFFGVCYSSAVTKICGYIYIPALSIMYTMHKEMDTFYAQRSFYSLSFVEILAVAFAPNRWLLSIVVYPLSSVYFWLQTREY